MPKNIVICCDGTGNEIEADLSNVLKLFRIVSKTPDQMVFYAPGIGTLSDSDLWSRVKNKLKVVFGLVTGYGLDANILEAYRFLIDHYESGDHIYLFGFSRGAYTVRAVAALIRLVGLLPPAQKNLCNYALTAYKMAAEKDELPIAWRFQQIAGGRRVPIKFVGVWDTVSSVFVPRPDRFFIPSMQKLPYTAKNELVEVFRHALAIDERRRMFRPNLWLSGQQHKADIFQDTGQPQNVKQVWFAGVHSDVGGGYAEAESGLAKLPLKWLIDEARQHGLQINQTMYDHLVLGRPRPNATKQYVPPDAAGPIHNSMNVGWSFLELLPKRLKWRATANRPSLLGFYLPLSQPRYIEPGTLIHQSVLDRRNNVPDYKPPNLPAEYVVEPH